MCRSGIGNEGRQQGQPLRSIDLILNRKEEEEELRKKKRKILRKIPELTKNGDEQRKSTCRH